MTDDKKMMHGEMSPEQEDALEDVTGGRVKPFEKPVYDPGPDTVPCPACGAGIDIDRVNPPYRVHCNSCDRWFHYEGKTLVEG